MGRVVESHVHFGMSVRYAQVPIHSLTAPSQRAGEAVEAVNAPEGVGALTPLLIKGPSPIRLEVLECWLKDYPNQQDRSYLLEGFRLGFRIPFQGSRTPYMAPNLKSVQGMEHIVREKIAKECTEGRVLGPFPSPPVSSLSVSPLGVVPKRASGEYRLIHHLSYPCGESVNDAIPEELCCVLLATLALIRPYEWCAAVDKERNWQNVTLSQPSASFLSTQLTLTSWDLLLKATFTWTGPFLWVALYPVLLLSSSVPF